MIFVLQITECMIIEVKEGKVLFSWKEYRRKWFRKMKFEIDEFICCFLLHVLSDGFFKIRLYVLFSSRYCKQNIEMANAILEQNALDLKEEDLEVGSQTWNKQSVVWPKILKAIDNFIKLYCALNPVMLATWLYLYVFKY